MNTSSDSWQQQGTFWLLDLDAPRPSGVAARVPATFTRVVEAAAARMLADAMRLPAEHVRARFAAGARCYVGAVDGVWASYGWVSFHEEQIGEISLRIRLKPGEAYIWDCATAPAYRRLRLYTALLAHIVAELRAEGFTRIWIGADSDNLPSQYGIATVGFQPVADLLINSASPARQLQLRGRPGAPTQIVSDVRQMLHGGDLIL
ncbi:MAG: GNAT family N-acetyltransferase [Chloroflexi bacterium]|nr:MAG: GNAT family N-acetyltransferase [Chloroflexota bacterium]